MSYNLTLAEIYEKLCTLNIPVAYLSFTQPQSLPFCVYYESGGDIYGADNKNLIERKNITIELYSEKKNPALERQIEDLFSDTELTKQADIWIESEKMIETIYEFEVINKR